MSLTSMLTETSVCKLFKVFIDDLEIPIDSVIHFEWQSTLWLPIQKGNLLLNSNYSFTNIKDNNFFNKAKEIKIQIRDNRGDYVTKYFRSVNVTHVESVIHFTLNDIVSYELMNTYINASYTNYPKNIFYTLITSQKYKIWNAIKKQKLKLDFKNDDSMKGTPFSFSIDSGKSLMLNFFSDLLVRQNIRFWIDDFGLHCYQFKLSEAEDCETNFWGSDLEYTNLQTNVDGYFYIHDYDKEFGKNDVKIPKQFISRLDNKKETKVPIDLNDFFKDIILNGNDDFKELQDTSGEKIITKDVNEDYVKYFMFNKYIQTNQLVIYVKGTLKYPQVGKICRVKLDDRSPYPDNQLKGDVTANGKYLITGVTNAIMGDKFIQRIQLSRFDNPKVIC